MVGGPLVPQGGQEKKPNPNSRETEKKQEAKKGCCRIKYEGGGFDYFPSTEEECVKHSGYHSFLKDSPLCFQSLWD
ncbi:hypothetical protein CH373_04675 [Leptospira perolatii]|uniref:Uncharacterized protein n=1 Tax=Leptospira perolatii TaxID=2023191 RepID=A0A2M9ZQW2_9LEPT|nr:hypothetical protein CH360_16920 [Leptospira perolatii]PJZ74466.1 hypothetical protein CH373_04675 [Leptospira perolatii]